MSSAIGLSLEYFPLKGVGDGLFVGVGFDIGIGDVDFVGVTLSDTLELGVGLVLGVAEGVGLAVGVIDGETEGNKSGNVFLKCVSNDFGSVFRILLDLSERNASNDNLDASCMDGSVKTSL